MKKDIRMAFIVSFIYVLAATLYITMTGAEDTLLSSTLFMPVMLAIILGIMGQSYIWIGILLLFTILGIWVIVFILIRVYRLIKKSASSPT